MESVAKQENIQAIIKELEKTRAELNILYEVSNSMRTTLLLDEILYIILTGVTAHTGLGFNRALLFLVDKANNLIEGKMAIGPQTGEEASRIWKQIEEEKMDMEDLIGVYRASKDSLKSSLLNQQITSIKIPLNEPSENLLTLVTQEAMPLHISGENIKKINSPILRLLNQTEEFVIIPLKAKDEVNGIIVADNFITKRPITKDDIRMLTMLANQAGLAIENSRLYEKTVMLAHTDPLSGLWNHGYFYYLLNEELEKARAKNQPLSLMLIDIDDFKRYNDTWGHQQGDAIIRELATLLKNQSRKMDHVCRYGGEEFAIILPETAKREAIIIGERLRNEIQNHTFLSKDNPSALTVSIGLASYPLDATHANELVNYADRCLYQAKKAGKNRLCGQVDI